jgi:hypothetical protein
MTIVLLMLLYTAQRKNVYMCFGPGRLKFDSLRPIQLCGEYPTFVDRYIYLGHKTS